MDNPTRPFSHFLQQLQHLLQHRIQSEDLLYVKLHENMFPLHQQISTAISFSLRCCCPLARRDVVSFKSETISLEALSKETELTIAYLATLPDDEFAGFEQLDMTFDAGFAKQTLVGQDYFLLYAFPNFLFHFNMAYAILRTKGQPLSKGDFDGFHHYPIGFCF